MTRAFFHAETTLFRFNLPPYLLETDERAESYTRIMMCASGKVDFIPRFKPQTKRPDVAFQTRARIQRSAHVVRAQVVYRADEPRKAGRPGIQPEIDKTSLDCQERTNRTAACRKLRPKETVQYLDIAVLKRNGPAARVREPLGERLVEVVTHLTFQHDVRQRLYAYACPQACHVALGLRDAEVISVSAHLKAILGGCQR